MECLLKGLWTMSNQNNLPNEESEFQEPVKYRCPFCVMDNVAVSFTEINDDDTEGDTWYDCTRCGARFRHPTVEGFNDQAEE